MLEEAGVPGEKTHAGTGRTCELHTESRRQIGLRCEATALTTAPLTHSQPLVATKGTAYILP